MALTLEHVSFVYGAGTKMAERAVEDASLVVGPGELAIVLGPTGSGKTTLLRLASGLIAPTTGIVLVDGRDPSERDPAEKRMPVGLAFQRPEVQLFANTIGEDVAFGPRNLGLDPSEAGEAAREAMEMVGLDPEVFGARSPFGLSGGEARRAALAGVLAMSPRYLLLDEPTSGLDVFGRRAVLEAIGRVRASAGVVVVTHDAEEFLELTDTVMVLDGGRTVFSGAVEDLLADAGRLEAEGQWIAPEHVRAQLIARAAGRIPGPPVLDPEAVARILYEGSRT